MPFDLSSVCVLCGWRLGVRLAVLPGLLTLAVADWSALQQHCSLPSLINLSHHEVFKLLAAADIHYCLSQFPWQTVPRWQGNGQDLKLAVFGK